MKDIIESVGLIIHAKDGRSKEILLELWQVDIVTNILGLQVDLPDLENYVMASKEMVETRLMPLRQQKKIKCALTEN